MASGYFSLVELKISLAIIDILLGVAMLACKDYLIPANKAAAKAVLMEVASRQEQFLMKNGTCSGSPPSAGCAFSEPADTVPTEDCASFALVLTAGTSPASRGGCPAGLPIFTITANGKAGTIQEGQPAAGAGTASSVNQFGLRLLNGMRFT